MTWTGILAVKSITGPGNPEENVVIVASGTKYEQAIVGDARSPRVTSNTEGDIIEVELKLTLPPGSSPDLELGDDLRAYGHWG